jgi:hypothetical protein
VAVVGSGAPLALLEGLLEARSALEGGKPGRASFAPPTPTAGDGQCCGGAHDAAEQERAKASCAGVVVHGSIEAW